MSEPDLYRLRECAGLGERAAIEDMPHNSFAYHRWVRRHVEELLYEDLWQATEPDHSEGGRAMTPAQMIEKYILLRNKLAEMKGKHAEQIEPYISVMKNLENELLRHLNTTKLDSINGPQGTAFKQTATSVTVDDWQQTLDYIREQKQWDLLEARVAKNAALTIIEETKKPIPGIKISQAVVLRVRAS